MADLDLDDFMRMLWRKAGRAASENAVTVAGGAEV